MKIKKEGNKYYKESNWEEVAGWISLGIIFVYAVFEIIKGVLNV